MFQALWQLVVLTALKRQNGQVTVYHVQVVLDPLSMDKNLQKDEKQFLVFFSVKRPFLSKIAY